jgi:hypothetical protein
MYEYVCMGVAERFTCLEFVGGIWIKLMAVAGHTPYVWQVVGIHLYHQLSA